MIAYRHLPDRALPRGEYRFEVRFADVSKKATATDAGAAEAPLLSVCLVLLHIVICFASLFSVYITSCYFISFIYQ